MARNDRTDQNSLNHTAQIEKLNRCYQDIMRKVSRGTATPMMVLKAAELDSQVKALQAALIEGKIAPRAGRGIAQAPRDEARSHGKVNHLGVDTIISTPRPAAVFNPVQLVTVKAGRGKVKRVIAKPSVPVEAKPWALVKIGRGYRAKRRNEHVTKPEATIDGRATVSVSEDDSFK